MKLIPKLVVAVLLALTFIGDSVLGDPVFAKTTSDPNHKGWTGKHPRSKQVRWKPIEAKCKHCTQMVDQYNNTMRQLLNSRYWVNFWTEVDKNRRKGKKDPFWPGKGDISQFEGKAVAANLELMDLQKAQITIHKNLVVTLEQQASYLRGAVIKCELTACGKAKKPKIKAIKIGGESDKQPWQPDRAAILKQHDVNWQGPYKTNCLTCKPIVVQLDAMPGWVTRAHFKLVVAEQRLAYAELVDRSNKIKIDSLKYDHPDRADFSKLAAQVNRYRAELRALKKLFEKLLVDLVTCEEKYCKSSKSSNVSLTKEQLVSLGSPDVCNYPTAHEPIEVGANNEVGSSANFKEKAKKKVAGAAMGAMAKLIGIGGGGGAKDPGPQTYKDPVKKKNKTRVRDKKAKRDLYAGGTFTSDGLLLSSDIKKAPGKGTYHEIYLENSRGWRLAPIGFYMYEIWKDWKLSVSWTKDTFVDGQLVRHEEGGWTESWRELIARGEEVVYGEVQMAPVWEQLGFTTAVSGARSLGTQFPVSPQMLADETWNLVIHISDPKKDPVVTVPYVFELSLDKKGRVVTEPVDNTTAYKNIDCDTIKQMAREDTLSSH